MLKGTIFVTPGDDNFKLDIYFREHKIISTTYQLKPYKKGKK